MRPTSHVHMPKKWVSVKVKFAHLSTTVLGGSRHQIEAMNAYTPENKSVVITGTGMPGI